MNWFKTDSRRMDHDRELLLRSQAIVSDPELDMFFDELREEQAYRLTLRKKVLGLLELFSSDEQRFEQRRLQQRLESLLAVLRDLKILTSMHFLAFPRNQSERFCLHPDYFVLEIDAGSLERHAFYLQAETDLKDLVRKGDKAMTAFRRASRKLL
ncbi:MAG TPA: hypothetical protein VJ955_04860 [Desulfuromonadales bacterium]|nr:hypothetical protein [Desulfuromonadales bacterium]